MVKKEQKQIDWDALEPHYRAGIRSLKDMGAEFEVSDAAIIKHARKNEWTRNLKAKIQAKADALVSAAMVSNTVSSVSAEKKLTEKVVVEVEAETQKVIRLSQRKDIGRSRLLALSLLEELESQTVDRDLYAQLGELLESPDEKGVDKLNEIYRKVTSTPSRIDSMKKLSETLKVLISLEREAYGINATEPSTPNSGQSDAHYRITFVDTKENAIINKSEGD